MWPVVTEGRGSDTGVVALYWCAVSMSMTLAAFCMLIRGIVVK